MSLCALYNMRRNRIMLLVAAVVTANASRINAVKELLAAEIPSKWVPHPGKKGQK